MVTIKLDEIIVGALSVPAKTNENNNENTNKITVTIGPVIDNSHLLQHVSNRGGRGDVIIGTTHQI